MTTVTDLHDRFRTLDRVDVPDLWSEVEERAATAMNELGPIVVHPRWLGESGRGPQSRRRLLLPAAALVALLLALIATLLFGSGAVRFERSPLGRTGVIVFSAGGDPTGLDQVHLVNADGTGDRVIGQGSCPAFSMNGSALAYRSGLRTSAELIVAKPDGTSAGAVEGIGEWQYALSPDGTHVAWLKNWNEVWVTPVSGGPGTRVAGSVVLDGQFLGLEWSPDGRRVAFATMALITNGGNQGSYRSAIDVVDADGSNPRRVTARPGTDGVGFSWSPDGQRLAYVGIPDGTPIPSLGPEADPEVASRLFSPPQDVFVINADGTGDQNVTQTAAFEFDPSWSPDGTHIAYRTFDESSTRLAAIEMGRLGPAGLPRLGPIADVFEWSPSGTELLVVTLSHRGAGRPDTPDVQPASWGTLSLVDREFQHDPATLLSAGNANHCKPSWRVIGP